MNGFSYVDLRRIIHEKINDKYDLIVEGGIGVNLARYNYLRSYGFTGHYVAIDKDQNLLSRIEIPTGINFVMGDCFDPEILSAIFAQYEPNCSIFLTNGALLDSLLIGEYKNPRKPIDVLTAFYSAQLHIRPTSKIDFYHPRFRKNSDTDETKKFKDFVSLSSKKGWRTQVISKNLIFMENMPLNIYT